MKKTCAAILISVFVLMMASAALAATNGTPAEAEAMVKKAVAFMKANGKDKAFAEINNTKGQFIDRDLYVFVYDMNGKCVAHGFNQKMIGKDLIEMKDPDGKFYVKERVEIAKTKGSGIQNYKFTNPDSKKIDDKSAYIEKHDNYIFGCGAYKN